MSSTTMTRPVLRNSTSSLECQSKRGCSAKTCVFVIMVAALLSASTLFYVWSRTEIVKAGYDMSDLSREIKELKVERERLKATAASLRSPERIESIARQDLDMQFPVQEQIKNVEYKPDKAESYEALASNAPQRREKKEN